MKLSALLATTFLGIVFGGATMYGAANVAILDSSVNTRAFFAAHYPACNPPASRFLGADEYQRYFRGWTYVLNHPSNPPAPIPFDIIHDAQVTDQTLSQYKVLILSNTASLSDDEDQTIQKWVIHGGRLLATFGAGYKSTIFDPRFVDNLKPAEGHTGGLHDLWHDPLSTVFGSDPLNNGAGTDVLITQYVGPTASLFGQLNGNVLLYGAESNILVHRPMNFPGALAFVILKNAALDHPEPAILLEQHAQGLVVYYAFAPEYLVSKEFGDTTVGIPLSCPDVSFAGRSTEGRILMEGTVRYLLSN